MPDILDIATLPGMPSLLLGASVDVAPVALVADSLSALAGFGVPVGGHLFALTGGASLNEVLSTTSDVVQGLGFLLGSTLWRDLPRSRRRSYATAPSTT